MGKLLSGQRPLRGRAGIEFLIRPLDYRVAADFWDISDPRLAIRVHSIVGGTPTYRTILNPETQTLRILSTSSKVIRTYSAD
jgi:hypothetical protein